MNTRITLSATYETITWSDEDEDGYTREGGYTSPTNPWGGLRYAMPDDVYGEAAAAWKAENAETVTFTSLVAAARFVADFPGGVWDYSESPWENDTSVTLHVEGSNEDVVAVFSLAEVMEARSARR